MRIGVCLKLVDRRAEVDLLTGAVHDNPRLAGSSDADQAALECALRCAAAWGDEVVAVTAGTADADAVLRDAVAAGADRAVRVDLDPRVASDVVAAALAAATATCDLVWCGDHSLDRGSGSVPAYLAAHLGAAQALGLVAVEIDANRPGVVVATRRLDRGRRERLRVGAPGVLSVEGATARLRRASVARSLASRSIAIDVVPGPMAGPALPRTSGPFRPRARVLAAPDGATAHDRIVGLTNAYGAPTATPPVELEPPDAAARILAALEDWGYLEPAPTRP